MGHVSMKVRTVLNKINVSVRMPPLTQTNPVTLLRTWDDNHSPNPSDLANPSFLRTLGSNGGSPATLYIIIKHSGRLRSPVYYT